MVTFDDTISTAKKYFDAAAAKTGEAVELSKCYIEKAQIKNKLDLLYERLGKAHYLTETGEKNENDIIEKLMDQIKEVKNDLKNADERYSELRSVNCPNCGKKNAPRSLYCSACGEKL